jgi:hypothetical protein
MAIAISFSRRLSYVKDSHRQLVLKKKKKDVKGEIYTWEVI